jgi:hypothetical protein
MTNLKGVSTRNALGQMACMAITLPTCYHVVMGDGDSTTVSPCQADGTSANGTHLTAEELVLLTPPLPPQFAHQIEDASKHPTLFSRPVAYRLCFPIHQTRIASTHHPPLLCAPTRHPPLTLSS